MTSEATLAPEHVRGQLQQWASGAYAQVDGTRTAAMVSIAPGAALELLDTGWLTEDTVILTPQDRPAPGLPGVHVGYEGDLSEGDDELVVGDDLCLQQQTYASSSFLAVSGPTVVRVWDGYDFEAFLEDADAAVAGGRFQENLLHPLVQLADLCVLGTRHRCAGALRLHLDADNAVRTTPAASALLDLSSSSGPAADALAELLSTRELDPCLPALLDEDVWTAARDERPWLSRYLDAVGALKRLHGDPAWSSVRVSGFGGRLLTGAPADIVEQEQAPLLLFTSAQALAVDPVSWRVFRLGLDAARLLEAALVTSSPAAASELAVAHFAGRGLDAPAVAAALAQVLTRLQAAGVSLPTALAAPAARGAQA